MCKQRQQGASLRRKDKPPETQRRLQIEIVESVHKDEPNPPPTLPLERLHLLPLQRPGRRLPTRHAQVAGRGG